MHLIASLSFISIATAQSWTVGQVVDTVSGKIQGQSSGWKPQVSEYLGIPYAQPPVGQLRFAAPKLFQSTSAVNATKFGPSCPQNIAGTLARDR
jgi:cholinesterase